MEKWIKNTSTLLDKKPRKCHSESCPRLVSWILSESNIYV